MLLMCKFYCCVYLFHCSNLPFLTPSPLLLVFHLSLSLLVYQQAKAVQAQYPSNVFLLYSGQESHDYSVQPQPGVFDHSHLMFNNGESTNSRKNSDENRRLMVGAQIEPFCTQQSHWPPFLDLSQLQNKNHQCSTVVSTGLRSAHTDQRQHQDRLWNLSRPFYFLPSDDFISHIKQQKHEVDQLLQAHAEEFRRELAEKMQRQYRELMSAAEASMTRKLREKEAEVEKAKSKENELEARACRLKVEGQIWQAKARSQEATAASLQAQLQRAVVVCGPDKKLCSGRDRENGTTMSGGCQAEDAESVYADPDQVMITGPSCRVCRKKAAAVVLLPCRHLCLCRGCEQVVQACPLCFCSRNFSVELNLS